MDINTLDSFITIAREKSITKASQLLHITQPALTSKLKKLENEVGAQLLERSKKGVELTMEGTSFLVSALKMIREFDSVYTHKKTVSPLPDNHLNSKLKIGITRPLSSTILPDILLSINEFNPNLKCNITSELTDFILDLILFGELDFGIVTYCKPNKELEFIPIYEDDLVLIGPKMDKNPLDQKKINHLKEKPFILFNSFLPLRHDANEVLLNMFGEMPHHIQEVNDTYALTRMIACGLGYSILPLSFILDFVKAPNTNVMQNFQNITPFRITKLDKYSKTRYIHLVYSKNISTTIPIKRLIEFILSSNKKMKTCIS
ncbi:LysR family transcriptional regulator [Niallia nealsonii]|uniref:HTH lysR-type domain-containing protein n=1 Tax=Niallia nealsonii TaxID=115979 RepID=A0A2N0Z4A9_9BACI|nr:LysR family transcriptional regulator [Niallia nealsonii]PKG24348.1 hypothetical protein CWS01_06945 [Niallia nealsonii]